MSRWYLVRHAPTDWNVEARVQGHSDVKLNEAGRRQAVLLARRLAGIPFVVACSSDLSRTMETAEAILRGRCVPMHATPELRELSYGCWEGMTYREIQARDPVLYGQLLTGDVTFAPPRGESVEALARRVGALTRRLNEDHPGDAGNVLVVGHGGSLRALVLSLLGLPVSAFWRFQIASASLSIVSLYPQGATLDLWNDTSHLEDKYGE